MADVNNIIRIQNLSKRFGDKVVLDNISLDVEKGENLVVFGRSGTGKSVLLKCIIGLLKPDSGKIFIKDKEVTSLSTKELNKVRRHTSFLFQGAALYDSMTVRENLKFSLQRNVEISDEDAEKKIVRTLNMVSLADAIDKMPSELSGGMKKRIGLARSIITDPEIMFYDEPTTGLDPISSKEISELILQLQKQLKMTSIIVTHDLNCANIISDRNIFLKDGKIAYHGTFTELANSNDKFLVNFFSTNIVE
ncbi:MAG: ATP-binding cassette domain-containing protein [Ignavibacteriales bacterium]|nr:ATP-binding cassette domain-containing protein [Ignavibacteriales bacterium]MBK7980385.1 ATP-binding cassette domain-containing protein [Ignavibacteriota bacterium]